MILPNIWKNHKKFQTTNQPVSIESIDKTSNFILFCGVTDAGPQPHSLQATIWQGLCQLDPEKLKFLPMFLLGDIHILMRVL